MVPCTERLAIAPVHQPRAHTHTTHKLCHCTLLLHLHSAPLPTDCRLSTSTRPLHLASRRRRQHSTSGARSSVLRRWRWQKATAHPDISCPVCGTCACAQRESVESGSWWQWQWQSSRELESRERRLSRRHGQEPGSPRSRSRVRRPAPSSQQGEQEQAVNVRACSVSGLTGVCVCALARADADARARRESVRLYVRTNTRRGGGSGYMIYHAAQAHCRVVLCPLAVIVIPFVVPFSVTLSRRAAARARAPVP